MTPMMANMEDLDRGWSWVVLAASFGYFMIFGMFLYGVGVVHLIMLEEYGGKSATTAWAPSLYAALVSLGGPISSIIIDRFSCRSAMFIDGLLTTLGCIITAFSPSLPLSIFTYGIMAGIGGGIGYTATMVVVGFNFRRLRNVALGISISGVGIGVCILSPVMEIIREFYGNSGYFIIISGIGFHKCLFATLCKPSELELCRQRCLQNEQRARFSKKQILTFYAKVYANKLIICFSLSLMLFSAGTYMIFVHLPTFAVSLDLSPIDAALLLSACGLTTVISRLVTTLATSRKDVDEMVLYFGTFGTLALGTFLFPLYAKSYVGLLVFSLILGSYFGGCYAIMNSINAKLVGLKYLSIATGMELLFCSLGTALGPVFTGLIIDGGGTYEHAFMLAAFFILIGAALGMASVVFQPDQDKPELPDLDFIITKDGEVLNETVSAQITNSNGKGRNGERNVIEKHKDTENKFCQGSSPSNNHSRRSKLTLFTNTVEEVEPVSFIEEIQKLLKGEELKFIDENE